MSVTGCGPRTTVYSPSGARGVAPRLDGRALIEAAGVRLDGPAAPLRLFGLDHGGQEGHEQRRLIALDTWEVGRGDSHALLEGRDVAAEDEAHLAELAGGSQVQGLRRLEGAQAALAYS